ncbi:hypothetical protein [Devosia sp. 1635]|uniref:hypothetical protein n=1 Tax=Devosia sp. 1635 TaxID=2726066 RepID=UPI0015665B6E|nr:hypothetical protein [Devosia sp. 1635]
MSKDDRQKEQLKHVDAGGHLGGTNFGQQGGEAKTEDTKEGGDKQRPNDGSN